MKTHYLIKDAAGRGYLAPNASTAFDLPRNWVANPRKAERFPDFESASAHAQGHFRRGFVEMIEAPRSSL